MSYKRVIDPREAALTGYSGFGGDVSDTFKDICTAEPSFSGCKSYYDTLYGAIRAKSKSIVKQLESDPVYGPVLAQALDGAKDPKEIGERARQLAAMFSGDDFQKKAYQFFYSQARTGLELADQYLSAYPQAVAIGGALRTTEEVYVEGQNIFQRYEKTGIDAAGVGDVMNLMKKAVGTARSLAVSFGVQEGTTADEILDWTGVAVGCGAAIATGAAAGGFGAIGGAITCAVSVLAKVFGKATKPPAVPPKELTAAVFVPFDTQRGLISADAMRLASILRYHYGYGDWNSLFNSAHQVGAGWAKLRRYGEKSEGIAIGFTPMQSIDLFGSIDSIMVDGFPVKVGLTATIPSAPWAGTGFQLKNSGDIDVVQSVNIARSLAASGRYSALTTWAELVTFFAAVTARELSIDPSYVAPWRDGLPVRFGYVTRDGKRYPAGAWSNTNISDLKDLMYRVSQVQTPAMYEIGCLRLLAALSYLKMMAEWGQPQSGSGMQSLYMGQDVMASLDNLDPWNPASSIRLPVNPKHQAWGGRIPSIQEVLNKIVARGATMNAIADAARHQASEDFKVIALAGSAARDFLMQQSGAPASSIASGMTTAAIKAMIQARGGLQYSDEAKANLQRLSQQQQQQSTGSAAPVIAIAAGLLALTFLK